MANYTTIDRIDLPAVVRSYGLAEARLEPLAGGAANSSFHLISTTGEFVLTILDNHDLPSAERLAVHTRAAFRQGMPTSEIVPSVDGSLITRLDGRPVVLKKWIEGRVVQPLPLELLPEAGRILGRLHGVPPETPGFSDIPVGGRRLSAGHRALIPGFADRDFAAWLTERLDRVDRLEAGRTRALAVVHGDLFDDNLLVRPDGGLAVLDWETVSLDDPLLDLGMAAIGLAKVDGLLAPDRFNALVSGYREVVPEADTTTVALAVEIEHAALIIAFHRYYRHNVRFPDPAKAALHTEMLGFVDSVKEVAPAFS
ncbi:phosphotransferase [Streptomyces sp. NPDC006798]|uniref:phosphotransferase n=1 Tax=Streptomyces sp. NPDC006798 TaxID=3155462 RepID=UPI0033E71ECF